MFKCPVANAEETAARRAEYLNAKDKLRRERDVYRHLYGRKAWRQLRIWKLNENPLCEAKEQDGTDCREGATVVHHIRDHRGDVALFFDRTNFQSLCESHHNAETMRRVNEARKNG